MTANATKSRPNLVLIIAHPVVQEMAHWTVHANLMQEASNHSTANASTRTHPNLVLTIAHPVVQDLAH